MRQKIGEWLSSAGRYLGLGHEAGELPEVDREILTQAVMLSDNIRSMRDSAGWKAMEELLLLDLRDRHNELARGDFHGLKQVTRLQGRIEELQHVLQLPEQILEQGAEARAKLEELRNG